MEHTIGTARIRDRGFVTERFWQRTEDEYEEAAGNGQFVAMIEGVTNDEFFDWTLVDPDKPGRLIEIGAEAYADLVAAIDWVRETYEVFSVHVETDEPEEPEHEDVVAAANGVVATLTRSAGSDGAVLVMLDTSFEPNASDGGPGLRVLLNDSPIYAGVAWASPEQELPTDPDAQSDYLDALDDRVRTIAVDAIERALLRFPNDAGAALRYASALLAVSAEEV